MKMLVFEFTVPDNCPARLALAVYTDGVICPIASAEAAVQDPEYKPVTGNYSRSDLAVGITIDCGHNDKNFEDIYRILESYYAGATFFLPGRFLNYCPERVQSFLSRGYEVATTKTHPRLNSLNPEQTFYELSYVQSKVVELGGYSCRYYRPPYGADTLAAKTYARYYGCDVIRWGVDSHDWDETYTAKRAVERVLKNVKPGDTLLLHNSNYNTKRILGTVLSELYQRGYSFVTISELLRPTPTIDSEPNPWAAIKFCP